MDSADLCSADAGEVGGEHGGGIAAVEAAVFEVRSGEVLLGGRGHKVEGGEHWKGDSDLLLAMWTTASGEDL